MVELVSSLGLNPVYMVPLVLWHGHYTVESLVVVVVVVMMVVDQYDVS